MDRAGDGPGAAVTVHSFVAAATLPGDTPPRHRRRLPLRRSAYSIVHPGGVISRVGVPQYEDAPVGFGSLFGKNVTPTGGPAPVRAYLEQVLPDVLDGTIDPRKVFDRTVGLQDVPAAYQAMDTREDLKILVTP